MKNLFLALFLLTVAAPAHAYQTIVGADPSATPDAEYKAALKSTTAGVSDAIAVGELVVYDATNNPAKSYIVTRVGGANTAIASSKLIAGVATVALATGDTATHLIQVRGYATVKYDATFGGNHDQTDILIGENVCVNNVGAAVKCRHAASATHVIALESKTSGTGTDLKVLVRSD